MTDNNGKELKIEMWVDEDRMDLLRKAKMETLAKDKFAGMKVVDISCTSDLKDKLLQLYPCAKCDTSNLNIAGSVGNRFKLPVLVLPLYHPVWIHFPCL